MRTILILEAECIVNGTQVAVNSDTRLPLLYLAGKNKAIAFFFPIDKGIIYILIYRYIYNSDLLHSYSSSFLRNFFRNPPQILKAGHK
jgi:hypothetical protein